MKEKINRTHIQHMQRKLANEKKIEMQKCYKKKILLETCANSVTSQHILTNESQPNKKSFAHHCNVMLVRRQKGTFENYRTHLVLSLAYCKTNEKSNVEVRRTQ